MIPLMRAALAKVEERHASHYKAQWVRVAAKTDGDADHKPDNKADLKTAATVAATAAPALEA